MTEPQVQPKRRPYRPPTGMPAGQRAAGRAGSFASALFHFVVIMLLFIPASYGRLVAPIEQGAGGPGPAGGGGGRSARSVEYINFVKAPPPAPVTKAPTFQFKPPPISQLPTPQLPALRPPDPITISAPSSGSATDGSGGAGPGSGGGVGNGVGTGRGSSLGPGTGGGNQENYPPRSDQLFLPPFPVPAALKGDTIIAQFDVDERGRVLSINFTETGDRAYNRRLREAFREYRWKPGTRPDGTPVRMIGQVTLVLP